MTAGVAQRVTVMLDDDLAKKLRDLQAKKIRKTGKSVSFSEILNEFAKKGIEHSRY